MRIEEIMTIRVATVSMDDRLNVLKVIFEQAHFRHLLVLEGGVLMGSSRLGTYCVSCSTESLSKVLIQGDARSQYQAI